MKPINETPREKFERMKATELTPIATTKSAPAVAAEPVKVKAPRKPRAAKKS